MSVVPLGAQPGNQVAILGQTSNQVFSGPYQQLIGAPNNGQVNFSNGNPNSTVPQSSSPMTNGP